MYEKVPRLVFPVLWFHHKMVIYDDLAGSLRLLQQLPQMGFYAACAMIAAGLILVNYVLYTYFRYRNKAPVTSSENGHIHKEEIPLNSPAATA